MNYLSASPIPTCLNTSKLLSLNLFEDGPCPNIPKDVEMTREITDLISRQCLRLVGDSKTKANLFFAEKSTPLDWISTSKDVYKVQGLILRGMTLEGEVDEEGQSYLHKAITNNNEAAALILMNSWRDINPVDHQGNTPLHLALEQRNSAMIKFLTRNGIIVSRRNNAGDTPIHIAVKNQDTEALGLLIKVGADVNAKQKRFNRNSKCIFEGKTPLYLAVESGRTDIARTLLKAGAEANNFVQYSQSKNEMVRTPISEAARLGKVKMVELLLEFEARLNHMNSDGTDPLSCAIESGDFDTFKTVFQKTPSPFFQKTHLHLAVQLGHADIVRELLKQTMPNALKDIFTEDSDGRTLLDLAKEKEDFETTRVLKEALNKDPFKVAVVLKQIINKSDAEVAAFLKQSLNKSDAEIAKILEEIKGGVNPALLGVLALAIAAVAYLLKTKKGNNAHPTKTESDSSSNEKIQEPPTTAEESIRLIELITKNQTEHSS